VSTAVYVVYATRTLDLDWLPGDATVVVVHNDESFDRGSLTRDVVHVDAPGNVGFGAGANLALPHVCGERVVLCNPDVSLGPSHWHALTAGVGQDAVVTVPLHEASGAPTSVCSRYPTPVSHLVSGYRLGRFAPRGSRTRALASRALGSWGRAHDDSLTAPAGCWPLAERWVSGAVCSIDATRLRAVGGFDDDYFLYLEDVDLCRRLADTFPGMSAVVADVEPGVHTVGASADGDSRRVERLRLDSAIRWATRQPGASWSVCAALLRARRRFLR
jgi:N-acetylglucosaminyl-diphospho-decaprenol L-rhamnosyltransferase